MWLGLEYRQDFQSHSPSWPLAECPEGQWGRGGRSCTTTMGRSSLLSPEAFYITPPLDLVSHALFPGAGEEGAFIFLAALSFKLNHTKQMPESK